MRTLFGAAAFASVVLLIPGFTLAQPFEAYLGRGTAKVIVWKDQAAMEKGKRSTVERDPLLVACIVPSGTKVLLDRVKASWGWTATVLEGESKGCQGVVGGVDFETAAEREKPPPRAATSPPPVGPDKPGLALGCIYVKHPEWVTMDKSTLLRVVQQAQERQRAIRLRQAQVDAEQRAIEADARFHGRPISNLAEYQAKRRQAILDTSVAEGEELDAKYAAEIARVDTPPRQDWKKAQAARTDCR